MRLIHRAEFRRLVAGYALSTVGDAGVRMLLAWVTLEQRGAAAMSGVFIGSAAACVFGPAVGRWLDRYSVRNILSATCLGRFALLLGLAVMSPSAVARYAAPFAFLSALFSLAYGPAVAKTIPAMFPAEKLREANASSGMWFLVASAVGPALGGLVLSRYGAGAACGFFAVLFLLNTPLSQFVTFPLPQPDSEEMKSPRAYIDVLLELSGMPTIAVLVFMGVALNFALAPINVALAPLMLSLGAGAEGFGFAMALFVVGAVAGNLAAGGRLLRVVSAERSIFASLGAIAVGFVAVGISRTPLQAAISILLIGAALPFFQVPVATQFQRSIPAATAGQMFATINSLTLVSAPLAAAGVGFLLKWLTSTQLFFGAALLSALLCAAWAIRRPQEASIERSFDGEIG